MQKIFSSLWKTLAMGILAAILVLVLTGCSEKKKSDTLVFATSADYPPFEYKEGGEFTGFEIELARQVAQHLHKKAVFKDMPFHSILAALNAGQARVAIATITVLPERQKNFDFSDIYFQQKMAVVFRRGTILPPYAPGSFYGKKLACQMGTFMETWCKREAGAHSVVLFDTAPQVVEAVKSRNVEAALLDAAQSEVFIQKNFPVLEQRIVEAEETGYAMMVRKGDPLAAEISAVLRQMKDSGELRQLQEKWLKNQASDRA